MIEFLLYSYNKNETDGCVENQLPYGTFMSIASIDVTKNFILYTPHDKLVKNVVSVESNLESYTLNVLVDVSIGDKNLYLRLDVPKKDIKLLTKELKH